MRVLIVTNMLPTPATPTEGVFIGEQIDSLRNRGLDVDVVHVERTQQGMRSYTALPRHLRRAVANGAPEVVHATYGGLLAYLTERATPSIPFVVSFCGSDLQGEPTSPPLPRATAQVGVLASRRVARRADEIVVKTSSLAMHLPTTVPQERVHVIPNGVSTERFRPLDREDCRARLGWSGPGPHVMLAGQPRPIKRPELARRAVELLRTDLEGAELHIPDGVSRDDMPRWLNASDAVVLTSRHEGSPNIVKEALACGTPIVSVPVGDVPERVRNVPNCRIISATAPAIARGLRSVIDATEPANPSVVADLSLDAVATRIEDVYGSAIERRKQDARTSSDRS